jgi:hypothetical protein
MSGHIFSETDQTGKIVRDRFVRKEIELPDSIAFELIHHALKIKNAQKDIWISLADDLNSRMHSSREEVRRTVWKGTDKGGDVLKGMLPLHPLAALLLKNISSAFASNQRSMFNFIKNAETENLQAFQWFIENYSPDNGDILSIDFLWNFFYEKGIDDHGTGVGRTNLDTIIRTVLDTYPKNENRLNTEEKRVLKTVLMMQAISQKLGDGVELFLPTDRNINMAFEGTDIEHNRAVNLAKKLVKDGILYEKPMGGGKTQYAAAAVSGDQAQIDIIKKRISDETKTVQLISNGNLVSALSLSAALRFRYTVTPVTIENFTATINRITNEPSTFKSNVVLSFARSDEEQNKIRELIRGAMKDVRYNALVFVDASSTVLGSDRFEQWVECAANEEYWRPKDGKLADEMSRKAMDILEDWKTDVTNGQFTIYSEFAKTGESCGNAASVLTTLSNIVIRKYPLSFDNAAKLSDQMFTPSTLPLGAKCGILQDCKGVFQQSFIVPLMQDAWQIEKYWESKSVLPLSKLKQKVDDQIKAAFDSDGRIAIGDIFDALMEQGFMPCNLYAFLTGFLLKEYAVDPYRYSDGETGDKISEEKLAEITGEYIKHKYTPIPRYREKFIEIMTREQMAFINFAKAAFGIPDNLSIEQTAIRIRSKLKELGYPIWSFKGIDSCGLEEFINKLTGLANPDSSGDNVSKIASIIGQMSLAMPNAAKNLSGLLAKENASKAIEDFLSRFENGDVLRLAKEINVQDVKLDVKRQLGSGEALWLWDQETGEEELRKLILDYEIVATSNRIIPKANSLYGCLQEWCEIVKSIRIPYSALLAEVPKLKVFLEMLREIVESGDLAYDKRSVFLAELENNSTGFFEFLENKADVFKNIYSFHLTGLSAAEVKSLYSALPVTSFTAEKSDYEKTVADSAEKQKSDQEKHKLHELWKEKTGTKTPEDWSERNRTPVFALVPIKLQGDCRRALDAINRKNPEDSEVKFALDFLQARAAFLSDLSDKLKVDAAFTHGIVGRFVALLPDIDEVRSHLESVVTTLPYDWYGDQGVQREIEKFAQARYNQGGSDKVLARIEKMDANKAKDYLKRLIKDNMNVGIEIISDGGSEA